jgi:hypothetical protein
MQRYLAPFLAGICFAGATIAHAIPVVALLILAGGFLGFCSLPAAVPMIKRIAGSPS